MKRTSLIALILAVPLAVSAQFVVFTDNFNAGSTTNHTSVPGGTPFASFTSYDVAATKAVLSNTTVNPGDFRIALDSPTSSGLVEVQALFTKAPITLVTVGDYINLTYTFRMTNALATSSAYIGQGLYNSGGVPPALGLNNSGLTGTAGSAFATGNCANWKGIFTRIFSSANSVAISRPIQNGAGTTSANQDLLGSGVTGGFNNPSGATLPGSTNAGVVALTTGAYYTMSLTITLADTNTPTLTMTNILYSGAGTGGSVLVVMTNVATDTNFQSSFDGFALGRRETLNTALITMDITNLTISENIFGLPGQPFNVTGGGQGCPGGTFPIGLNGSVTTNDYYVYTNGVWNGVKQTGTGAALNFGAETILSVPLTNTVFASNTVNGFTGFMLGSVVVAPNAAPTITTQPFPVIVANGSIGVFAVSAAGGGLTYQWFKNGGQLTDGGHISGSTTPTLVVSPVGAGDAATTAQGYYCVVTSGCAISSITTTNSLTIAAPASIVWQGNNPDTNWDLSATANFLNGATPVVFHNGDNVTFNDSAAAFVLSIANNYTAPTLITESANNTYIFKGPGVIQGPGALQMSGAGVLSINNSNAYSGGTTISAGTLIASNQFALGTGPITLSGGTFDVPLGFGSAVGLSNNINVTADSTLKYDPNGTFACVLNGNITGNPGATLTVNSANGSVPSTSRLRLYGQFTNNANIALITGGTEMEFAPYLPSGNQVYNGLISGNGGHIVPRGAGNAIFNNTNTFNDTGLGVNASGYSLFMSSGNVGIGADSVSASPPTIDASPVGTGMVGINVGNEGGTDVFFASGGAHTIGNQFQYTSTTNTVTVVFGGTNNLTLSGEFDLARGADSVGTNRTIQVTNTAATTLSGVITDNGVSSGILKTGNGTLYLNGVNTYSGLTTVSNGTVSGVGTIAGAVLVGANGTLGGGSAAAIGTLTISGNLDLNGSVFARVNKSLAQSNDLVSVSGTLNGTGAGTVTVSNLGPALVVGDKFALFSGPVAGAGTMTVTGGGMNWTNKLAIDGSIQVLSVATGVATNPTNISFSVTGTTLHLTWPGDHLGWTLLTNSVGLKSTSNWFPVTGSASVTNEDLTIDRNKTNVFFRLVYPYP